MAGDAPDLWSRWLRHTRHGGDPEDRRRVLETLGPVRDRLLEGARIQPGDVVLDLGTGEGLVAFGALPLVGETGRVIFTDVSEELLARCRSLAGELGALERCTFVRAAAEDLGKVPSASVDAVTVRSVLIYVREKPAALAELHRVLRPGGRLSIFEPINRFAFPGRGNLLFGYDVSAVADLAERVVAAWRADAGPPETDPMLDFDERDLLRWVHDAGFPEVHLALEVDVTPPAPGRGRSWEGFRGFAPNPRAPTLQEAIESALDSREAQRFTDHLRRRVEGTLPGQRWAVAWYRAVKAASPGAG